MNLAGFNGIYDEVVNAGIAANLPEIHFDPARKPYEDGRMMVYEPKVREGQTQGFYNFTGFQATLLENGEVLDRQFIYNIMTKGMTLDNSYTALNGGTVLHSDWNNDTRKPRMVFTRFDLDPKRISPKGQHPIVRVDATRVNMSALMGQESIVGNTAMLEKYLKELQTGNPVYAQVREKVNGEDQQNYYWLMLNLKSTKEMAMDVISPETGKVVRQRIEPVRQREIAKTEGLVLDTDKTLPPGFSKSASIPGAEVGGDNVRQIMSADQLLRRFQNSKKEGGATVGETTPEGDKKDKKEGLVTGMAKSLLMDDKSQGKGQGKGNGKGGGISNAA